HPVVLLAFERRRQGAAERIARVGGDARVGLRLRVVGVDLRDAGVGQAIRGEICRALERHDAAVVAHRGIRARTEALRDGDRRAADGVADPDLRDPGVGPRLRIAARLEGYQVLLGAQDRVPARTEALAHLRDGAAAAAEKDLARSLVSGAGEV